MPRRGGAPAELFTNPDALAALSVDQLDALRKTSRKSFATPAELAAMAAKLVA